MCHIASVNVAACMVLSRRACICITAGKQIARPKGHMRSSRRVVPRLGEDRDEWECG